MLKNKTQCLTLQVIIKGEREWIIMNRKNKTQRLNLEMMIKGKREQTIIDNKLIGG